LRRSREFVRANREFETAIQRFPDDVFRKFGGVSLEVSWFDSAKLMLSVGFQQSSRAVSDSRQKLARHRHQSQANCLSLKKISPCRLILVPATLA
jgi:hypothetical protein